MRAGTRTQETDPVTTRNQERAVETQLDARLTDPQAARLVAERDRLTVGLTPRHLAGISVARARARQGEPGPVEDGAGSATCGRSAADRAEPGRSVRAGAEPGVRAAV